jgi:hypothetical protein
MEDLIGLGIGGVSLAWLALTIVERLKEVAPEMNARLVSMFVGAILSIMWFLYGKGIPVTMQDWILMVLFVAVGAFSPSGTYDSTRGLR